MGNTSIRAVLKELADGPGDYWSSPDVPLSPLTRFYARGCHKIAVVRDPVRRFLSAYGNRVIFHRDIGLRAYDRLIAKALGLSLTPGIEEFCARYRLYYLSNDKIRRHFRLQRQYLGGDLGYFDKIYKLEELDRLAEDLSQMAGRKIEIPRLQTGGPKLRFEDLPCETRRKILAITGPDYKFLKGIYEPPEA